MERLVVHASVDWRADPAGVLIHDKHAPAGNKTTLSLAQECFDIGNVMKDVGHTDRSHGFVVEWQSGCIDDPVNTHIGQRIGSDKLRDHLLHEAAARTEFNGWSAARSAAQTV